MHEYTARYRLYMIILSKEANISGQLLIQNIFNGTISMEIRSVILNI